MRVEREILHHPRFVKLKLLSGNPAALEWLIALWGYCQKQRCCRFEGMTPDNLADACGAIIDGNKLLSFLVDCRWVRMEEKTLVVRKWEHWNAGLIQRWEAGEKTRVARLATDKRPPDGRSPSASAVPRKMDGWMDRKRAGAHGLAVGRGEKDKAATSGRTLKLISETDCAPGSPVQAENPAIDAAYDIKNTVPASDEQRAAMIKKFGSLSKVLADQLKPR